MNFNNNNISSLFGSLNGNNSFGSINFSDYASIKNGSYGKLLKSNHILIIDMKIEIIKENLIIVLTLGA